MPAYAILQINILNRENYKEYVQKASPIVESFGGEYLVRGGKSEVVEGKWEFPRTVVVRFPSYDKAIKWYNSAEYAPIKKIRETNSEGNCIIIEGV